MPQIDSITALGRLLRDGALRDAYAAHPEQTIHDLEVTETERERLLDLNPEDLEAQALVLLRKRFETVAQLIPQTCAGLHDGGWPLFAEYARSCWPSGEAAGVVDAKQFSRFLATKKQLTVSRTEGNRISFCLGTKRMAVHWASDLVVRGQPRIGFQVFLRRTRSTWSEHAIYFAL